MSLLEELRALRERVNSIPESGKRDGWKVSIIKNTLTRCLIECEQLAAPSELDHAVTELRSRKP